MIPDSLTGLKSSHLRELRRIFNHYPEVKEVLIFGSRATGRYHDRSDIDLAIRNSIIDRKILGRIRSDFDESDIPYTVDLLVLEQVQDQGLKNEIMKEGKIIYSRNETKSLIDQCPEA